VQDGGAVLGFSYFDLMARLQVNGPDDSWRRLRSILAWFDEVQAEGGYRAYYAKPGRGTLQGAGTAGGLGLDAEFMESLLVPQAMLRGFLGLEPRPTGFALRPALPADWPSLRVTRIHIHDAVLDVEASRDAVAFEVRHVTTERPRPLEIDLPAGSWRLSAGAAVADLEGARARLVLRPEPGSTVRVERSPE
jgi:hypothetical protein